MLSCFQGKNCFTYCIKIPKCYHAFRGKTVLLIVSKFLNVIMLSEEKLFYLLYQNSQMLASFPGKNCFTYCIKIPKC